MQIGATFARKLRSSLPIFDSLPFRKGYPVMSTSYKSLLAQREALEKQIQEARDLERGQAVENIKETMRIYDISVAELTGKKTRKYTKRPVPPKYRDPSSGKTWTGRGKPPVWIAGKNRDQFLIVH